MKLSKDCIQDMVHMKENQFFYKLWNIEISTKKEISLLMTAKRPVLIKRNKAIGEQLKMGVLFIVVHTPTLKILVSFATN